jgi:hypothetical protein
MDQNSADMLELILPVATVMLYASDLNRCVPTRQTGWKFDGEPRYIKPTRRTGQTRTCYEIYNNGDPHLKLELCRISSMHEARILSVA